MRDVPRGRLPYQRPVANPARTAGRTETVTW